MSTNSKQEKLSLLCENYKQHLAHSIAKLARKMPKDVFNAYCDKNGELQIDKIVAQFKTGRSLYWILLEKYQLEERTSKELHPTLHLAIKKYSIVNKMLSELNNPTLADTEEKRISNFRNILNTENKDTLKERRDSSRGMHFLENVMHVLTLGIYSKLSKGTFKFWQSHGQALADKATDVSDSVEPRMPK